jgi:hypothetical protein
LTRIDGLHGRSKEKSYDTIGKSAELSKGQTPRRRAIFFADPVRACDAAARVARVSFRWKAR